MKKLRLITMLSAFALAAAGAFGLANLKEGKKAQSVDAVNYSGSIILQKNDNDMKYTGSKLVAYFFDDNSHNGWGDAIWNTDHKYQEYSWTLTFQPTKCIMLRVDGTNWNSGSPWNNVWCRTGNVTYSDLGVLYMDGNASESSGWGTYGVDAVVKGGASDSWSVATVDTALTNIKINGSDHLEVYGEVNLPANTYFKVVKTGSDWCGSYTAHPLILSNLTGGGNSNIHNIAAAKYEFYFDYDAKTTYITDPAHAAADEWAQYFLNHVGCDSTGTTSPTGWTACATEYGKLSGDAKDLVYGATAKEDGSYIEQAVARYDAALRSHPSLTKFIVNSSSQARGINISVNPLSTISDKSNMVVAIIVISLISVTAIGGYFFIRKRKSI